ncbi:hypothetical protein Achl_4039 (plasmid) [Pseudarthrobacter chlorophenolicus A6]|uniref:Uncharacterized protein n=1 Tax=Pseudarthrobacter chlorophenolicus (strain ATCC 700700 / DSM 12829 / CIP 107037 / JCM 12360 / KCTC 9906 / NCIMB 13794 / A6) TaxID=452863 RepID=B8HHU3_PSECP|nr:hypothetical protein [Pseudarthrobacter chlorophenolicus]ACL41990.1 hypothetical protein Achl_4039 [Pseudarthrobacter chlorophenolicus A6]SDQ19967.1 hypothetical protein SAMN04489738_0690 [Pseudarthrobacter chlorophenolicus]
MTTLPHRQARGIPGGGQFAAVTHAEPDLSLAPQREDLPPQKPWTEKRIREAAAARYVAAQGLKKEMAAAASVLNVKKRAADQEFFDWDTDFAAGSLRGRLRRMYLKDRATLREMFSEDPEYRYNRGYTHKPLAPLRESAQLLISRALNGIAERTGGDSEWFIRL